MSKCDGETTRRTEEGREYWCDEKQQWSDWRCGHYGRGGSSTITGNVKITGQGYGRKQ